MVCLGNICRSPMAEGIFRKKAEEKKLNVIVDSAGTADYHVDEAPDVRAIATAKKFGVNISNLRGRQFSKKDFELFDRIYVMDASNYRNVIALAANEEQKQKVYYLLHSISEELTDVPDPWFGGDQDFVEVFKLIDEACENLAAELLSVKENN
jgi:protein-tyrosine phosphatase